MKVNNTYIFTFVASILAHHHHVSAHDENSASSHNHMMHNEEDHYYSHIDSFKGLSDNESSSSTNGRLRRLNDNIERCGSKTPTLAQFKEASKVVAKWMTNKLLRLDQQSSVEIDTYFHVIMDGINGNISSAELQNQLNVLNDSYRPYGFSFRLKGTTYTNNSNWYRSGPGSRSQTDMKKSLRVGDASTLNVYFNIPSLVFRSLLGYAVFPWDYADSPEDDGVVILNRSLPGGLAPYGEGKTLVHEVGHWLGLFHTFQTDLGIFAIINFFLSLVKLRNGCNTAGDDVGDTPRQRSATRGCPTRRDSCPLHPGRDPINNFMDYSDDSCLSELTPGQIDRMWAMWMEYRAV